MSHLSAALLRPTSFAYNQPQVINDQRLNAHAGHSFSSKKCTMVALCVLGCIAANLLLPSSAAVILTTAVILTALAATACLSCCCLDTDTSTLPNLIPISPNHDHPRSRGLRPDALAHFFYNSLPHQHNPHTYVQSGLRSDNPFTSQRTHIGQGRNNSPTSQRTHIGQGRSQSPTTQRTHIGQGRNNSPTSQRTHIGQGRSQSPTQPHYHTHPGEGRDNQSTSQRTHIGQGRSS